MGLCPEDPLYCWGHSPREVETFLGGHTLGSANKSISSLCGSHGKLWKSNVRQFLKREHRMLHLILRRAGGPGLESTSSYPGSSWKSTVLSPHRPGSRINLRNPHEEPRSLCPHLDHCVVLPGLSVWIGLWDPVWPLPTAQAP